MSIYWAKLKFIKAAAPLYNTSKLRYGKSFQST
jgi:hypothetical protein